MKNHHKLSWDLEKKSKQVAHQERKSTVFTPLNKMEIW